MTDAFQTLQSLLSLGGPIVVILFAVSIFSLAVILLKLWQFLWANAGSSRRAHVLLRQFQAGETEASIFDYGRERSASAGAVALAVSLRTRGGLDRATIEEEVNRFATQRLHQLQGGFRLLDAISQLAPLLGLFGTVIGMIDAFQQMQGAGSNIDPSLLAGGIWVALLTTAAGLAVAMPVSLVLTLLETRVENERVNIETLVSETLSPLHENRAGKPVTLAYPAKGALHAH
jgi:biopolymer transport protein ExbB